MEIHKVKTLAFAISEKKESEIVKSLQKKGGNILNLIIKKENEIRKGYFPVISYKLIRPVQVHKGITRQALYENKENVFFVNLNSGLLYYYKNNKLQSFELLNIIKNMRPEAVRVLGSLVTGGESLREELPQDLLSELFRAGLVKMYKPAFTQLMSSVVDEVISDTDDGKHVKHTIVKDRVDRNFHLPSFDDKGYDLTRSIKAVNQMRDSYLKEPIKCSVDQYANLLKWIYESEASVDGIYFLPYIRCSMDKSTKGKKDCVSEYQFPVCGTSDSCKTLEDVAISPIALSSEVGAVGAVPVERETIDFSSIAGLDDVKKEIRESIIYPIIRPELAKEYHRKSGGGILLYGPPGCGKTHIAKATIGECGAAFYNINISDLVKKGFEGGAKSLHDIFEEATKNAPAIIFFDELDAVGGKRDLKQSQNERMLIDQLLTEMDGVESLGESILFIGATNSPWSIDPALRRSERFTKQLFIPPPDTKTRVELFGIHTKKEPLSKDVNYEKLSDLTEGYSSADIKAVCDEAAKIPWEKALEDGIEREITLVDFVSAIKKRASSLIPWYKSAYRALEESGERDVYPDFTKQIMKFAGGVDAVIKPDLSFKDVGNMEDVKEEIRKSIIYPLQRADLAEEFGQKIGGGILLYGPPGCGKTYIARATAGECKAMFFNVTITDVISSLKGESEKKIHEVFERAMINSPSILFFDEIDAIAGRRDNLNIEEARIVDEFLTELDGFNKEKGVIVIAATNAPWTLDPALRRAGRFTKQIYVGPPEQDAREEIFRIHCRGKPVAKDVDFESLAEMTKNYTPADIDAVCNAAAEIPWNEALKGRVERKVTTEDFIEAIKKINSSLSIWVNEAKREIEKSGESEAYSELSKMLNEYESSDQKNIKAVLREESAKLIDCNIVKGFESEKEDLIEKMKLAQHKYYKREMSEEDLKKIINEYEKQLIDLDLAINKRKRAEKHSP